MKYKVGDKVRVKYTQCVKDVYSTKNTVIVFTYEMREFCGQIVTISCVDSDEYYKIKEDNAQHSWTDEMFEDMIVYEKRWSVIAELLGLELNDKFDIDGYGYNPCRITAYGIFDNDDDEIDYLQPIINGEVKIKKRTWKPKISQEYYCITIDGEIIKDRVGTVHDVAMIKNGYCFKTKEEAEDNMEWVLKEYEEVMK